MNQASYIIFNHLRKLYGYIFDIIQERWFLFVHTVEMLLYTVLVLGSVAAQAATVLSRQSTFQSFMTPARVFRFVRSATSLTIVHANHGSFVVMMMMMMMPAVVAQQMKMLLVCKWKVRKENRLVLRQARYNNKLSLLHIDYINIENKCVFVCDFKWKCFFFFFNHTDLCLSNTFITKIK